MPRKAASPASATGPDDAILDIDGQKVKLTRLSKVLYPKARFTKAQIIDYYVRVAPFLLPHLKDRPVTLKRYPDGVMAQAFWEKDAPSFKPRWVQTFPVPRRAGGQDICYILINNAATLAWTANIAALELHPFLHRAPQIQQPSSIVFDLDPGEGADIFSCIEIALMIRGLFERLDLQVFPKVSGSKGLQIYLPLNTPVTYDIARPFAQSVAQLIESEHPDLAISAMPKEKRTGKVFIDWSQNSDFKTTVGVYSLRAKSDQPYVSMPVSWAELEKAQKRKDSSPLYFNPAQALSRLDKMGDLFAPVISLQQKLPENIAASVKPKPAASRAKKSAPEPSLPRRSAQGSKRRFVIQKHAASHLHYDFRLEMAGVLKSWAVPKGVPYEPGTRRLASATEDHPTEYLSFEGVIPAGQYGGGTVMVWDIGTYEIVEGNYWKGKLHISLAGKKLRGEWSLRRDAAKGANAWVLEKCAPALESASSGDDDRSVLTNRTMAEIAHARDAVWQSNRQPKDEEMEQLPESDAAFIEPMQCKRVSTLPRGEQWEYEAKFDGYRALIVRTNEVRIVSRRNNSLTNDFPSLVSAFSALPENTVIDGEIVALGSDGKPSFNALQNHRLLPGGVQFYAFDLLVFRGRRLLGLPLEKRRGRLKDVIASLPAPANYSESFTAELDVLIPAAEKAGFEGIVAKRRDSVYEAGKRTGAWSKIRFHLDQELVIGGYLPGPRGFDALLVGYYDQSKLLFCGKVRNGFAAPGAKEAVFARFRGLGAKKCPFENLPEPASARRGMALTQEAMRLCCWLKPELVAQIGIREWTADGHLRHSTFLGMREDKNARDVVRESDPSH